MARVAAEQLRAALEGIFRAAGADEHAASVVSGSLIDAELAGHASHGLIRVTEYLRQIREGSIVPTARPEIVRDGGAGFVVDGHWGFGQVVAGWTTDALIDRALDRSMAAAGIRRCGHVGRAGAYPEAAAERGLVAFAFVNGGGTEPRVAPHGGGRAVFGTNPLAAAVPVADGPPIVVDFSTAVVASGKIRLYRDRGEPLPEGWILDRDGRPSRRPEDYYDGGMLLPAAEHKGYALCLLVELLAGCLTGAGSIALPGSGYRGGNGMFLMALDVEAVVPVADFSKIARDLAAEVKATPPAAGHEGVLLPGEPERRTAERLAADGIDVPDSTWRGIAAAAAELEVELPI